MPDAKNNFSKNILLGICGGIAAYKCCELVRRLRDQGHAVQVVLTDSASHFVSSTTLQALSGRSVRASLWDEAAEAAMGHIELARWADVILIAPASANTIAKLAHGFASDLLSTLCLASAAPVLLAPAMNQQMWAHAATQANLALLHARGVRSVGPGEGAQACGDVGAGRMAEVPELLAAIQDVLQPVAQFLAGKRIWISAGPTREPVDPVRFISNLSSGKMGFALAQAAARAGASVTLIAGPCALPTPGGVRRIDVDTALEMQAQCEGALTQADWFIAAAAVADYRPVQVAAEKIKKNSDQMTLELTRNPDIIGEISAKRSKSSAKSPLLVGFAAETEKLLENAMSKRQRKGLDFILANAVGKALGMETADNELWLLGEQLEVHFPRTDKQTLAYAVLKKLSEISV